MTNGSRFFSKGIKLDVFKREKGICQICGCKVLSAEYDHIVPWAVSEDSSASNCQLACARCHRIKTSTIDVPAISKSQRIYEKRAGVRTKRKFPQRKDPWGKGRDA